MSWRLWRYFTRILSRRIVLMLTWPNANRATTMAVSASPARCVSVASPDVTVVKESLRFHEGRTRCISRPSPTTSSVAVDPVSEHATDPAHIPVMTAEVLDALSVTPDGVYVDCNVGEGGHTGAVLRASVNVSLLGIDLDREALEAAESHLSFAPHAVLVQGNFADVAQLASAHESTPADGVLFDLGVSSRQLDTPGRGFSFRHEAPLDMRFSTDGRTTADSIVNKYPERELEAVIREFGEEPRARAIARAIVRRRPIETTTRLAGVVAGASSRSARRRIHPATRTFQALRIAVNGEMENLKAGLEGAIRILRPGGRLVVISYHSLEDRLVKELLRREASTCICPPSTPVCICGHEPSLRLINRRVITPSAEEVKSNPRARSAKMRIAERI